MVACCCPHLPPPPSPAGCQPTGRGAAMDDATTLAPIAVLIDSLRAQDAALRLQSVKKLSTISLALGALRSGSPQPRCAVCSLTGVLHMAWPPQTCGCRLLSTHCCTMWLHVSGPPWSPPRDRPNPTARPPAAGEERTRRELIPFVNESVDDEDEILLALAEELGEFVPLVGGAQHAHFLLQPLESLATVDETVVRERAVASIVAVTAQMPAASVQEHLLPLLQVGRQVGDCLQQAGGPACMVGQAYAGLRHAGWRISLWPAARARWASHAPHCCPLCSGWWGASGRRACRHASCLPRLIRRHRCMLLGPCRPEIMCFASVMRQHPHLPATAVPLTHVPPPACCHAPFNRNPAGQSCVRPSSSCATTRRPWSGARQPRCAPGTSRLCRCCQLRNLWV